MVQDILQQTFLSNRISSYLISLSIFVAGVITIQIFKTIVLTRLKKWAERTATRLDDLLIRLIDKKLLPIVYLGLIYISIQWLTLNQSLEKVIEAAGLILVTIFAVRLLLTVAIYALETYWEKKEEDASRRLTLRLIHTILRIIVWGFAVIIILDNFGVKITTLIAGLGIGGVAIALAAQVILKDLFSYFIIFFDKPFEIGDFIIVGDYLGVVEHVGIKTTRLSSLGGEQIIFSNTDLTDSRVRNYKRMAKRRVVFNLGVTYQTTSEQLKEIPVIVSTIIKNVKDTIFDRAHFLSYGDFSLLYEVVYYVIGSDYNKYMDIQQAINFEIKEAFEKRGIEFAYPTQTLFLAKDNKGE
jgi:small-conductance mechanosensitive channel